MRLSQVSPPSASNPSSSSKPKQNIRYDRRPDPRPEILTLSFLPYTPFPLPSSLSQCPYFLNSCPLIPISNTTHPLQNEHANPSPLPPPSTNSLGVPTATSSLPPYQVAGPPSLLLKGVSIGPPSIFNRRKQYRADMLRNQLQQQKEGRKGVQPATAVATSSLPTTFPLPSFATANAWEPSSEFSSNNFYKRASSDQRDSSVDLNHYPSSVSSSSTDSIASPFNDILLSPSPYFFPHQSKHLPGVFSNLLQLHNSHPIQYQQDQYQHQHTFEDDVLSSLTAPFPAAPPLFGEEDSKESLFGGSLELENMLHPEDLSFGMEAEEEAFVATRPVEIAAKVESPPVETLGPASVPEEDAVSDIRAQSDNGELPGEQTTAFISKVSLSRFSPSLFLVCLVA